MSRRGIAGLAAASGLLMALSHPLGPQIPIGSGDGIPALAWVALAPLLLASALAGRLRHACVAGLIAGGVAHGVVLSWMLPFLTRWGGLPATAAWAVFLILIGYLASYSALFAAMVNVWSRRLGWPAALALAPAAWTGLELARAHLLSGFPWGTLGSSQHSWPLVIQVADIGGVYAISFALAGFSTVIACVLMRLTRRPGGGSAACASAHLAAVAACVLYGAARVETAGPRSDVTVSLIQANVPQEEKWNPQARNVIEERHFRMTREAVRQGASLVVWSESAVPRSVSSDTAFAARLEALARETGAEILTGSVAYELPARPAGARIPYNSAFLVRPEIGMAGRSDKILLVPFGEYVPLERLLFFVDTWVEQAGSFAAGRDVRILRAESGALGVPICYEVIFPSIARRGVAAGAEILVNITNDAWYGDTGMPRQHLAQSVIRAVETRRWLLRCANTGISAVVDPHGGIVKRAELGKEEILTSGVERLNGITPYVALGDWFAMACAILALLALVHACTSPPEPARKAS